MYGIKYPRVDNSSISALLRDNQDQPKYYQMLVEKRDAYRKELLSQVAEKKKREQAERNRELQLDLQNLQSPWKEVESFRAVSPEASPVTLLRLSPERRFQKEFHQSNLFVFTEEPKKREEIQKEYRLALQKQIHEKHVLNANRIR